MRHGKLKVSKVNEKLLDLSTARAECDVYHNCEDVGTYVGLIKNAHSDTSLKDRRHRLVIEESELCSNYRQCN